MKFSPFCLNNVKTAKKIFAGLVYGGLLCSPCLADKSIFCGAADQLKKIQFIPIAQMDNEMLFETVGEILNGGMSSEQRLLNHYWLMIDSPNTLNGGKALNKLIALTFTSYTEDSFHAIGNSALGDDSKERSAVMALMGQYQLRLSTHSVQIGFKKRF